MIATLSNHMADLVGLFGGNISTGGTIPEGSNWFWEALRGITGQPNSAHNSYGINAPAGLWRDSGGRPVFRAIGATGTQP